MVACTECRKSKVKCDQVFPCQRCQRLGLSCSPHVSQQGRNRWKNKRHKKGREGKCEDIVIASKAMEYTPSLNREHHFGLNHLVRKWIALALKRRSFKLLERTASLAAKCNISMDSVLCGSSGSHGMDFICPFLMTPGAEQQVVGNALRTNEVPASLWNSMGIFEGVNLEESLERRWIFVREVNKGLSRFYMSPGFERHVVSRALIEETYKANKMDIVDLYVVSSPGDYIRGLSHQIAFHDKPGMVATPFRVSNVRIKAKLNGSVDEEATVIDTDQIWCLAIPHVDHDFFLTEFVPRDAGRTDELDQLSNLDGIDGDDDARFLYDLFQQLD